MTEIYKAGIRKSVAKIKEVVAKMGSESLFTAFVTFPKQIHFEQQEHGEEVVLFLRQHFIVNVPWIVMALVALFIQALFPLFPPYADLPASYQLVVTLLWYLLVFGFVLGNLMGWFFNIFILTDERVVDVDFINLFMRRVSVAKIEQIQDVSASTAGALGTLLHFGKVTIQTAANIPEFEFNNVPNPDKVAAILHQLIDQEEQEKLEGRVK